MKVRLIRIGNSQGIRIPKSLIEQCGLGDEAELRVEGDTLLLRPVRPTRDGWESAFAAAAMDDDDEPLPDRLSEAWDGSEWTW